MTEHDRSLDVEHIAEGGEVGAVLVDRAALPGVGTSARTAAQQVEGRESVTVLVEPLHQRTPCGVVVLKTVNEHEITVTSSRLPDSQIRAPNGVALHVVNHGCKLTRTSDIAR